METLTDAVAHTDGRRPPGRPRDALRDVAILQAVLDLVAEHGLTQLSIEAVAARAHAGKGTIYRRWSSKEALVLDAWRTLIAPAESPDTGSLRGDVLAYLTGMLDKMSGSTVDVLAQITAAARTDPALAGALQEYLTQRRQPMRRALDRARERGELRADVDLDVVHDALSGPIFSRFLFAHAPIDTGVIEQLVDVVLDGAVNRRGGRRR